MRIPWSFGEISVIRSAARLLIPLFGVGLILAMIYAGTVWMERILAEEDTLVEQLPATANSVATGEELSEETRTARRSRFH